MALDATLTPIGRVHCAVSERHAVRRGGDRARIEIFEPYWPALDQIEHNTHIILFGWFHASVRQTLKTRPRKVAPLASERGVFASRSPDRPNPIAMTIVPLLGRDGGTLDVAHLDFIDGTPIVDIKPYCPGWDSVFSATHRRRSHPNEQSDEVLLGFFERDLENHVGSAIAATREGRLAIRACQLATRHLNCDPRDSRLLLRLHQLDRLMDGLMAITGASLSNGRLSFVGHHMNVLGTNAGSNPQVVVEDLNKSIDENRMISSPIRPVPEDIPRLPRRVDLTLEDKTLALEEIPDESLWKILDSF
ncbi:MAG: tRNA (N6-threonylcarbamoyladenosine(37)-N6)-methyltransferase TrmO [Myxococcaceae bacterium]|nr:tRNA (N6-threonylcarbamoyladenosine(37)-N6)-methyltransferase TrmO [Myxococcaceae bacterium]